MDFIKDIIIIIIAIPIFLWALMNVIPLFLGIIAIILDILKNLWDKHYILSFHDGLKHGIIFSAIKICIVIFCMFITLFLSLDKDILFKLTSYFSYMFLFIIIITTLIRLKIKYLIGFLITEEIISTVSILIIYMILS